MEAVGDVRKFYLHVRTHDYFCSPEEKEERKKRDHVFLIVSDESDDEGGEDEMPSYLAHNPNMDFHFLNGTTSVCVDSFIYLLGGYELPQHMLNSSDSSCDIWYIDVSSPSNAWIKGPPMAFPREKPCAVAVDRKIYVFGGKPPIDKYCSWAEVFDTQTQTWSNLKLPSHSTKKDLTEGLLVNLDVDIDVNGYKMKKFVLLYSFREGSMYFYDLIGSNWGWFDLSFGKWDNHSQKLVLSGTTLFALKYNKLHAYNVVSREWFKHPVKGLDFPETPDDYPADISPRLYAVYLGGGRLCLVLFPVLHICGPSITSCTWFTVCEDDNSDLVAKVYRTTKFYLHMSKLMNVFPSPVFSEVSTRLGKRKTLCLKELGDEEPEKKLRAD